MNYRELKQQLDVLEKQHHNDKVGNDSYFTKGNGKVVETRIFELKHEVEEVKIILDPNDTEAILSTIKEIANSAEMAHDFNSDLCGVFFKDMPKKGLVWWIAEVLDKYIQKTHTKTVISALNNLQVAYEAVQASDTRVVIDMCPETGATVELDEYFVFQGMTAPIAIIITLLDYELKDNNKPVVTSDTKTMEFVGLPGLI